MATVTPNFNWPVPTSTDLVKDGATAIEALGDSIDASLVDLKGGTTGQVLSKTTNADMDFTWVTSDDANAIQNTIVDAKGDLIAATAADTPARLAVGTNGQVLTADSTAATGLAWATASSGSTNVAGKNGVLNSQFNVWQRGTSGSASGTSAGTGYNADRWWNYYAGTMTVSRQATGDTTNLPFIQYCARIQRNSGQTSATSIYHGQDFETLNSIAYAGKTVAFSFYARKGANFSGASSALALSVQSGTGTDQHVLSGFTGSTNPISTSATLTTTWQRFTYTGTIPTDSTQLAVYFTYDGVGTAGANDYFEVTGVQLEIAGSASAYSPNTSTYQAELAACLRYYDKRGGQTGTGTILNNALSNSAGTNAAFNFPVNMRVAPTSVEYASLRLSDTSSGFTVSSVTLTNCTPTTANVNVATTGMTAFRSCYLDSSATGNYIAFSAEL